MARLDKQQSAGTTVKRFLHVARALYYEPWLIEAQMHDTLCRMFWQHVSGAAHEPGGIVESFSIGPKGAEGDRGSAGSRGPGSHTGTRTDIAVIPVHGVIGHRFSMMLNSSGVMSVDVLQGLVEQAAADEATGGILLDIDSPGGTVAGVPEAGEAIRAAAESKPVVAHGNGMMASAAYWLASGATAIYATQSSIVGSIGVYAAILDNSREMEMKGQRTELFTTGAFKAMGLPGTALTDEQRDHIQAGVDEVFGWFKSAVRKRRTVSDDAMQGQTFHGPEAAAQGLIDRVGSFSDAMQELVDLIDGAEEAE
ncbi:MAG: S49 family peptidase [Pseudomonadota bacterium]